MKAALVTLVLGMIIGWFIGYEASPEQAPEAVTKGEQSESASDLEEQTTSISTPKQEHLAISNSQTQLIAQLKKDNDSLIDQNAQLKEQVTQLDQSLLAARGVEESRLQERQALRDTPEERQELSLQLLDVSQMEDQMRQAFESSLKSVSGGDEEKLQSVLDNPKIFEELSKDFAKLYAKHLTSVEIHDSIEFYLSPSGRTLLEKTPQMMPDMIEVMKKHIMKLQGEMDLSSNQNSPGSANQENL